LPMDNRFPPLDDDRNIVSPTQGNQGDKSTTIKQRRKRGTARAIQPRLPLSHLFPRSVHPTFGW
jgi:hypothetical protein